MVVRLVGTEAAGGVILTLAVAAALAWANLDGATYRTVWDHVLRWPPLPSTLFSTSRQWVDDGVMTVFFFAVGLEVGRERHRGSLQDNRDALLPVAAALGGMAGAALVYLATAGALGAGTLGSSAARAGWGVPMATDVAFTLGAMALLGRRVPTALRVFVLALAVADDVASVVVLAVASSTGVRWWAVAGAAACLGGVVAMRRRVLAWWPYVAATVAVWLLLAWGGVEPTLAGAFVGALVPCGVPVVRATGAEGDAARWSGPSGRLEAATGPLSVLVALPLFALANTGIVLNGDLVTNPLDRTVLVSVVVARLVGKAAGITLAVLVVRWLGRVGLPEGVRWSQLVGVAAMCGMGFTVPLLFATTAFAGHGRLVDAAAAGLLAGTVLAFATGAVLLGVAARHAAPRPSGRYRAGR